LAESSSVSAEPAIVRAESTNTLATPRNSFRLELNVSMRIAASLSAAIISASLLGSRKSGVRTELVGGEASTADDGTTIADVVSTTTVILTGYGRQP
jgi:hypothetical protein